MMKLSASKLALAALTAVSAVGSAFAAPIDFESTALGSYANLTIDGVTFSGELTVSDDANGQYVNAAPGTRFLDNRFGGVPFTFTFAATDYFGLQIGATNSAQTLSAFDAADNLLGTVAIPNQVSDLSYPYTGFYSIAHAGTTKVTLTAGDGDWIVLDNVTVGAVPEPETYALMGLGLGALALARRRKAV